MQQPFRVYIAAASTPDQIERVTTWANCLTKAGIAVVSTWPSAIANDQGGITNPRDASTDQRRRWSAQDIAEVGSADALWLMCPPSGGSTRGAWVELGCAYTRALLIVSSGDTRQTIVDRFAQQDQQQRHVAVETTRGLLFVLIEWLQAQGFKLP